MIGPLKVKGTVFHLGSVVAAADPCFFETMC